MATTRDLNNELEVMDMEAKALTEKTIPADVEYGTQYNIIVKSYNSGMERKLTVFPTNTLGQAYKATASDLGINDRENVIFVNEKTQASVSDSDMTIGEFGIGDGNTLIIQPDGMVAYLR